MTLTWPRIENPSSLTKLEVCVCLAFLFMLPEQYTEVPGVEPGLKPISGVHTVPPKDGSIEWVVTNLEIFIT